MDHHLHNLNGHQKFLREFIQLYKQQECLWKRDHPNYKSRNERSEAYEVLVNKCKEYIPEADEDYVRLRIDSMRSTFRKERKKVLNSRSENSDSKNVYKPSLWYYDLLLFTTGETNEDQDDTKPEVSTEETQEDDNIVRIPFWGREYSSLLINLYKEHTCLYALDDPNYKCKHKRTEAVKEITQELMEKTGKTFLQEDVRRKIHLLRGQFMYEYRKIQRHKQSGNDVATYRPSLWCFNMLTFLKKNVVRMDFMLKRKDLRSQRQAKKKKTSEGASESESNADEMKHENDSLDDEDAFDTIENDSFENLESSSFDINEIKLDIEDSDDVCDTIGKIMAKRLRDMSHEQSTIAQKLIHDLMYHGQMENLTENSKLEL